MRAIKGVSFDLFGTLVEEVNRHESPEFAVVAEALGASHEALATAWVETSLERDRGNDGEFPNYVVHFARRLPRSSTSASFERAVEEWRGVMRKDLTPRKDGT